MNELEARKNDHVVVVPTRDTIDLLDKYLATAPFDTERRDRWHLTLYVGKGPISEEYLNKFAKYSAKTVQVSFWFDEQLGRTNLVLVVESPELVRRHQELQLVTGVPSYYGNLFIPHMTLKYDFPQLSEAYKAFCNSLSMSMDRIRETDTIHFESEMLLDSDGLIPNASGMRWYAKRMGMLLE